MEPTPVTLFRVKGTCYRTEVEAQTAAAGSGEWGTDETITKVEALEWQGKLYQPALLTLGSLPAEMTDLFQKLGRNEFVRLRDQMRRI